MPDIVSCIFAHLSKLMLILLHSVQSFVEKIGTSCPRQELANVIPDQFAVACDVRHDSGAMAHHRFDERQRHTFIPGRQQTRVVAVPEILHVGNEPCEFNILKLQVRHRTERAFVHSAAGKT